MASGMNVFAVGASRNIGYITSLRLLKKGATVTMLLRNSSSMDGDAELRKYVTSGQARLVKGDAMKLEDVANGWAEAQKASASGHVDAVFFAVGGQLEKVTLTGGGRISTPNLCTASMLNVLRSMPASHRAPSAQPKLVVISSTGITKRSHEHIPLLERVVYSWLLDHPHTDKFGMERVLAHVSGAAWHDAEYRSLEGVLPPDAEWIALEGVPEAGSFKNLLIVRPAWLTDGPCKAEGEGGKKVKRYVVADDDEVPVGYAISRKDVAYFVAEEALDPARWEEWRGRRVSLAY